MASITTDPNLDITAIVPAPRTLEEDEYFKSELLALVSTHSCHHSDAAAERNESFKENRVFGRVCRGPYRALHDLIQEKEGFQRDAEQLRGLVETLTAEVMKLREENHELKKKDEARAKSEMWREAKFL